MQFLAIHKESNVRMLCSKYKIISVLAAKIIMIASVTDAAILKVIPVHCLSEH